MIKYFTFSLSIAFISWIVGMVITPLISKTDFYKQRLSNLNFIKADRFERVIGLGIFKWIILHSFFKYFNPKLSMAKKIQTSELEEYRSEMTKAELNHHFAFLFMSNFILIKVFKGLYLFALVMLLTNIVMNLYPSLLQQRNKKRIDRFLLVIDHRSRRNL